MDSRLSYSYLPRARTSEERHDRNGNILTLKRLNGTEYAAISMTRTGNRLTTADVSEWDGDVDSPRYYRGSFVYKDVSISVPTGCLQTR